MGGPGLARQIGQAKTGQGRAGPGRGVWPCILGGSRREEDRDGRAHVFFSLEGAYAGRDGGTSKQ